MQVVTKVCESSGLLRSFDKSLNARSNQPYVHLLKALSSSGSLPQERLTQGQRRAMAINGH